MQDTIPPAALALIGKILYRERADVEVHSNEIRTGCAAVQNGNPLYWDENVAIALCDGVIAPPTMLSTWTRPHIWRPEAESEQCALQAHFDLKRLLDFPDAIISSIELAFGVPVRSGDRLTSWQVVRSISEPKTTSLGQGRFWVIDVMYENQSGEFVGSEAYTAFGYATQPESAVQ